MIEEIEKYNPREEGSTIWINIPSNKLHEILKKLKEIGFEHLSMINITDWIDKDVFEIGYFLWSSKYKKNIVVKTEIDRENAKIKTSSDIWNESAAIHERELHELFGVEFEKNNDLAPLFLEDWKEKPPFRKDFDWHEYVRKNYYDNNNEREKAYFDKNVTKN
ncbi:MAG: NADH-quinone oxidoreductase subunit C [Thermoplasmata archaeon]|nr:NADH-quinone oxidoreductase subunit C [Thermoplasmata archaeon]